MFIVELTTTHHILLNGILTAQTLNNMLLDLKE